MIKWLVKSTNELRIDDFADVEKFHKEVQKEADEIGCTLASFSWVEKENKRAEEIYYQIKYTFVFNKLADPDVPLNKITYSLYDSSDED